MRNILWEEQPITALDRYIWQYKNYFRELYTDTGIFGEELILERYSEEAQNRRDEILERIEGRLSPDVVHGAMPTNTLFLSWRSKTLCISWIDEGNNRIITNLIIQ